MKKVTINEIAASLKLSRNTVSKVLNNTGTVSDDTAVKVIRKAIELGYTKLDPELLKKIKNLKEEKTKNIAVLAHKYYTEFWSRIINGISFELNKNQYTLSYTYISREDEEELNIPINILNHNVDGIIVVSVFKRDYMQKLIDTGLPIVYLDAPVEDDTSTLKGDIVLVEGQDSTYKITKHLIDNGCKKIGFIGDITYCKTIYERWLGFKNALIDNNLPVLDEICFTHSSENRFYSEHEVFNALATIKKMPDAIVCANDGIALNVIRYLKDHDIRVPEDIAVTGFDDTKEAVLIEPNITTVHVYNEEIGRRSAEELLKRIENPKRVYSTIRISTDIKIRESSLKKK
ncbi:LacI family DNA-binding transcriptional regulator [Caldicellulosiruptoraceae bacterium PP1]